MGLTYGEMPLDRCTNQRKNKRWLASEFNREDSLFCVINDGQCLLSADDLHTPLYLTKSQLPSLLVNNCIFLGKGILDIPAQPSLSNDKYVNDKRAFFAVDFNKLRFDTQEAISARGQWQALKAVTSALNNVDASIFSLAKALVHWHISHQFCGQCGHAARAIEAGHARRCDNCRNMTFPRTDPAVIMLVEKMFDDGIARCLLGRQAKWNQGVYSVLAGFVDPGETLEQAVIREVVEETGIHVERPTYIDSQPWPFPASIMLGFTAVATSEQIDISQDDLEDAQWFSREQLSKFGHNEYSGEPDNTNNTEAAKFKMSSSNSISSYLIKAWLNKEIGHY